MRHPPLARSRLRRLRWLRGRRRNDIGTRSTIAMVTNRGGIDAIYCHFDGYPEHVGKILYSSYADEKRATKLMDMGHVNQLGRTLAKCRFYRRDMGCAEEDTRKVTHKSLSEAVAAMVGGFGREYLYLFADMRWMVHALRGDGFYRLQDALAVLKPPKDDRRTFIYHSSEFDGIMQASGLRPRQFNAPSSLLA